MKKTLLIFLTVIIAALSLLTLSAGAIYNDELNAELAKIDEKEKLESERFYVVNIDTDTVMFKQKETEHCAPASLTKIVTAIVAMENCSDLNTKVTLNQSAVDALVGTGSSLGGIKVGETLSLRDMLACLLIPSANEAAMAIAEFIGNGSVETFVKMMNDTATSLGCVDSHFVNPHGLDQDGHYSCCKDMITFARHAMQLPGFAEIVSQSTYHLPATNMQDERDIETTNFMLHERIDEYYVDGICGIKTGSTTNAGRCVVAMATRDGYTYMAAVMGGLYYDRDDDGYMENTAFIDARRMMNWSFKHIRLKAVATPAQIAKVYDVKYASGVDHLRLVPDKEYAALVPSTVEASGVLIEPIDDGHLPETLRAPIKAGKKICRGKVIYAGEELLEIDLVAAEDVRFSIFSFIGTVCKDIFTSAVFKVLFVLLLIFIAIYVGVTIYKNSMRNKNKIRPVK